MRRKDREKDENFALEVLKSAPYAILSLTKPEGGAYGVPISQAVIGRDVYFHCAMEGFKLECIEHEPRVCLTAVSSAVPTPEDYSMDYSSAVLFGRAEKVTDEGEKIEALRAICQRYAPDNMEMFESYIPRYLAHTCVVKITAGEITGKQRKTR